MLFSYLRPLIAKLFIFLVAAIFFQACSFQEEIPVPTRAELAMQRPIKNAESPVLIEPFTSSVDKSGDKDQDFGVELTWDIPKESVDSFVLYSGSNPDALNIETHLAISELSVVDGNKYRYVVKPIKQGEPFYVSLAASYKGTISSRSAVQKIDTDRVE